MSISGSWSNFQSPPFLGDQRKICVCDNPQFFLGGGENKDHAVFLQGMRKQCWPPNDKNRHFQAWETLREPVDE